MNNKVFDAQEFVLDNGLKFISVKRESQLMSINIGIKVGALVENKAEKGISHFIEHMLFKGTNERNNEILNGELEQIGGEYNAYTDYSCTVYSITALREELENSLKLLSDMLLNSIFPEDEIEKERGVILAEIRTSRDDIEEYSFNKINEVAFSKSPLKYDVIGDEKIVKAINKKKLVDFYKKYYVPNNCYITIVSNFDHEEVLFLINKYFNDWKCQQLKMEKVIEEKNIPQVTTSYKKDIEQSTIIYLYTFYGLSDYEELVLRILNHRFGASNNSILFRKLREERGLAYDVYSEMDSSYHVKTLYIYTSVSDEYVNEAISIIDDCIASIIKRKIIFDDSSIELMKKVLKTAIASTLEDPTELGNYVMHRSVDGDDIYGFVNDMEMLKNIKREEIYLTAETVFSKPTIHILLPGKSE